LIVLITAKLDPENLLPRRLLDLEAAAIYTGTSYATVADWVADRILIPVPMPGSRIRSRKKEDGSMSAEVRPRDHKLDKILIDVRDLDELIDKAKAEAD
jgi:hypothetical protein